MREIEISDIILYLCIILIGSSVNFANAQHYINDNSILSESHICNKGIDYNKDLSCYFYYNNSIFDNKVFLILQFKDIPNSQKIKELKANGIELLAYISERRYVSSIVTDIKLSVIKNSNIIAFDEIAINHKLSPTMGEERSKQLNWRRINSML